MLFLNKHKQNWLCPAASCTNNHPKTLSFRAKVEHIKEPILVAPEVTTLGSLFTNSSETASISSESDDCSAVETIVRGARSERLFFEPDSTSSIVESRQGSCREACAVGVKYEGSVVVVMQSMNVYLDFKKSMEEMVELHGFKHNWDCLQELLAWYLRMNDKANHEFIVEAFVDLLLGFSTCHHDDNDDDDDDDDDDDGVVVVDDTIASFSSAGSNFCSDHVSSSNGD
ncbi:hypothetical protein QVD17_23335 [Tagetes erecta]|uniref:Transcription repressor n=1 Tax=Tagetes erecta TaxID=13708 RepID=A0AAD8KIW5_TARER|nr:hypothetical protein QVD17_23335 [Tagetes erecta]